LCHAKTAPLARIWAIATDHRGEAIAAKTISTLGARKNTPNDSKLGIACPAQSPGSGN
jgi:hypothetical protein